MFHERDVKNLEKGLLITVGLHLTKHPWTTSPSQKKKKKEKKKKNWLVHCELNSQEFRCPKSQIYYIIASGFAGVPLAVNSQPMWHLEE